MNWQHQLQKIVESRSLVPTFEEWIDATGYRHYVHSISAGPLDLQATAMNSLYEFYQTEMRKRFPR